MLALSLEFVLLILGSVAVLIWLAVQHTEHPRFGYLITAGLFLMLIGILMLWYTIVYCPCTYEFGNTTMSNTEQPPYVTISNTSIYTCCAYDPLFPGNYSTDGITAPDGEPPIPPPSSAQVAFGMILILTGLYTFLAGASTPVEMVRAQNTHDDHDQENE